MEENADTFTAPEFKKENFLNLRSEMAQEIISSKPSFSENWALPIFTGVLFLLAGISWFIKYPDIVEASAVLTSSNAPKDIVTRQNGRLVQLFFHNNERVKKGEIIGWIESTAQPEEVIALSKKIDEAAGQVFFDRAKLSPDIFNYRYNQLGELQHVYQEFVKAWLVFNDYKSEGFFSHKRSLLMTDVNTLNKTNAILQEQKELLVQDIGLAAESFKMNETLSEQKVLTKEEYRIEKSKFVNKKMALPQLEASMLANESQIRDKQKEINLLEHDFSQQKAIFQQAFLSLKSEVDNWKKQYLLVSPVDGNLFFTIPIQENQYLLADKPIGYISPDNNHYYVETMLPQVNFGKIDTGLKVQLRFDAYPYQEAGFVLGTLNYISKVPSDSGFFATIKLDRGLITNSKRTIPYKNKLKARAVIITRDRRLFNRFYSSIVKSTSVGKK